MVEPEELELTTDDMYQDGAIVQFDDGTSILTKPDNDDYFVGAGDQYVEFVEGQELTQYGYAYYNNSKLWWQIADVNKVFNPFDIAPGTGLIIPNQDNLDKYYGT